MKGNLLFYFCWFIFDIFRVIVLKLCYIIDVNGSREWIFMSYVDYNISNLRFKGCIKLLLIFVVLVGKFLVNYFVFFGVVWFKGIIFILYLNYIWYLIWIWNVKNFICFFYCIYLYFILKIVGVIKEIKFRDNLKIFLLDL